MSGLSELRKSFSRLRMNDFNAHLAHKFLQLLRSSGERGESAEMHGNDRLGTQQSARVGSLTRAHGVVVADGDHGDVRLVELANDVHVAEDVGVTGVVDLHVVLKMN